MNKDQSKDFLFDPYAAAYYARFTDFNPLKHSLTAFFIASEATNSSAINKSQEGVQYPNLVMT